MRGRVACVLGVVGAVAAAAGFLALRSRSAASPELSIVLTGELRARVRRCGCQGPKGPQFEREAWIGTCCKQRYFGETVQLPDFGGLPERSAWLARLRGRGGDVLSLDAGDLLFPSPEPRPYERAEWKRRAELLVSSYAMLGVAAYVPGELDLALGRETFLELMGRARFRTLAANLADAKTHALLFPASAVFETSSGRVGVVGVFAPPLGGDTALFAREGLEVLDPIEKARPAVEALRGEGVDLVVLLAHASEGVVRKIVRATPGIDLAFGAHAEVDAASDSPLEGATAIARALPGGGAPVVATVRVRRGAHGVTDPDAFVETRHWLAEYGKQLQRQEGERSRATDPAAIRTLDEQIAWTKKKIGETEAKLDTGGPKHEARVRAYALDARDLKEGQDQALLRAIDAFKTDVEAIALDPALVAEMEKPLRSPSGRDAGYVTRAACASCHEKQEAIWQASKHAHAWASLELAGNQKDPECVRCHSTGFREPGGFAEVRRAARVLDHRNVQCESCHGPRLGHPHEDVGAPRPTLETCRRCHDGERDPTFDRKRMEDALREGRVCSKN